MTANDMRDWIIRQVESVLPTDAPDLFSQADYEVIKKWWSDQIRSRIRLEMCEKLAAADLYAFPGLWASEVNRVLAEIEAEMEKSIAASAADGAAGTKDIDLRKFQRWLQHAVSHKHPPQ